jgi:hypothetical protein
MPVSPHWQEEVPASTLNWLRSIELEWRQKPQNAD